MPHIRRNKAYNSTRRYYFSSHEQSTKYMLPVASNRIMKISVLTLCLLFSPTSSSLSVPPSVLFMVGLNDVLGRLADAILLLLLLSYPLHNNWMHLVPYTIQETTFEWLKIEGTPESYAISLRNLTLCFQPQLLHNNKKIVWECVNNLPDQEVPQCHQPDSHNLRDESEDKDAYTMWNMHHWLVVGLWKGRSIAVKKLDK